MLKRLALPILLALVPCSQVVRAETPSAPAGDTLSDDEGLTMCAEALPKQLACKEEFCVAMVQLRTKGDKKVDREAMEAKCLKEIALDGTGDLATRKDRCAGWIKNRPKMSMKRADAKAMNACWGKATCKERIDCWSPKMSQVMEAAAPKKKP